MRAQSATEPKPAPNSEREFLKYTFFKVDSQWRRLSGDEKSTAKEEFASLVERFSASHILVSYSLIGIRGDTDFMFWVISRQLEDFQELTASLLSSTLGKYLEIPYSYLAITRQSEYLGGHQHDGQEGLSTVRRPGGSKYLFLYPFIKKREWYFLPFDERRIAMAEHFKVGHKYPSVKIHTGYSFGLDDQEFVLAFEADEPADFSELVMELRGSEASRYTELETPLFTCLVKDTRSILDLLG